MQRLQAYKFELMPNGAQQRDMRRFSGACRFVFNKALALQKANTQAGEKFIGYVAMAKRLTDWRNGQDTPWLKDAPCHPLQHALKDLERAYKNFFAKRADFPRFKRKGSGESFRYPDAKQFKLDGGNGRIFLPKLGWMRLALSREVLGTLRNATLSLNAGKWYVTFRLSAKWCSRCRPPAQPLVSTWVLLVLPRCRTARSLPRSTASKSTNNAWPATSGA